MCISDCVQASLVEDELVVCGGQSASGEFLLDVLFIMDREFFSYSPLPHPLFVFSWVSWLVDRIIPPVDCFIAAVPDFGCHFKGPW